MLSEFSTLQEKLASELLKCTELREQVEQGGGGAQAEALAARVEALEAKLEACTSELEKQREGVEKAGEVSVEAMAGMLKLAQTVEGFEEELEALRLLAEREKGARAAAMAREKQRLDKELQKLRGLVRRSEDDDRLMEIERGGRSAADATLSQQLNAPPQHHHHSFTTPICLSIGAA
jgi:hypothetical protein